jgi:glucan phosphoethanolaminetransferase (alkaline phosphatase superfamily)
MKEAKSNKNPNYFLLKAFASILVNALGFFLFIDVSTRFNPKFGNTFYIIVGCLLIAVASIYLWLLIKDNFFRKKKSKKSKMVFLSKTKNQ